MTGAAWAELGLAALAGAALAAIYLAMLSRSVALFTGGRGPWRAVALTVARLALAGLAFWLAARQGAGPLIALFAGFLALRTLWLRRSVAALGGERGP